ncbi:MAG TPA: EamA family transporter [Terriglobia bacterium]
MEIKLRLVVFIGIVVLTGTAGDICVTRAMKRIGEVTSFRPSVVLPMLFRAFRHATMWLGIALMAVAFFSLLALLSWADASLVVPATALSYVTGAFGAKFILGEKVAPVRWAGVILVCMGVVLLSLS